MTEDRTETEAELTPATIAHLAADVILDKKGADLLVLDVDACSDFASFMVIATGVNKRQVQAMGEAIVTDLKGRGRLPLAQSGRELGWWVLVDYGDVIIHLMQEDARRYYDLEALWADARVVRRGVEEPAA